MLLYWLSIHVRYLIILHFFYNCHRSNWNRYCITQSNCNFFNFIPILYVWKCFFCNFYHRCSVECTYMLVLNMYEAMKVGYTTSHFIRADFILSSCCSINSLDSQYIILLLMFRLRSEGKFDSLLVFASVLYEEDWSFSVLSILDISHIPQCKFVEVS